MGVLDTLSIERAYELVTGQSTANSRRAGRHVRVSCPWVDHVDDHASCDLDTDKNTWLCRSCPHGDAGGGGVLDLPIAAGIAQNHAHAAQWYEERLGIQKPSPSRKVAEYVYVLEDGTPFGRIERWEPDPDDPGKKKGFKQLRYDGGQFKYGLGGRELPLYHLDQVRRVAVARGTIYLVEGEGKCDTLNAALVRAGAMHSVATTIAGGSNKQMAPFQVAQFANARAVIVLPDSDKQGHLAATQRAHLIAKAHPNCDVRIVDLFPNRPRTEKGLDVADWLPSNDVREIARMARKAERIVPRSRIEGLETMAELLDAPVEEIDWLVEGLLPSGTINLLSAKPKVGKTVVARNIALAVARGTMFLDRRCKPGLVVYLALEERRENVIAEFRRMGATRDLPVRVWARHAEDDPLAFLMSLMDEKPALIIVDTLIRMVRLEEIERYGKTSVALEPLLKFSHETGITQLWLHHNKKGDASDAIDAASGSNALTALVDTTINLQRNNDGQRTMRTVQRVGIDMEETVLSMDPDTHLISSPGTKQMVAQRAAEQSILDAIEAHGAMTREQMLASAGSRRYVANDAINSMLQHGWLKIHSGTGKKGDPLRYVVADAHAPPQSKPVEATEVALEF